MVIINNFIHGHDEYGSQGPAGPEGPAGPPGSGIQPWTDINPRHVSMRYWQLSDKKGGPRTMWADPDGTLHVKKYVAVKDKNGEICMNGKCMTAANFEKLNKLAKNINVDNAGNVTFNKGITHKGLVKLNNALYIRPFNRPENKSNPNAGYEYVIYGWDGGGSNNQWIEQSRRNPAVAPGTTTHSIAWRKTSLRVTPTGYTTYP